jgi:hypothetical protein
MKTCRTCGEEKELSEFYKSKNYCDGHNTQCQSCNKKRAKEIKSDQILQLKRQIRSSIILENKILAKDGKKICSKCKDIFSLNELYGAILCKKCALEQQRKSDEKNKDKVSARKRKYREKNKEKINEYQKEYREKNKEKLKEKSKEYQREYRAKIKQNRS